MASFAQEKPKARELKLINKLAYGTGDLSGAIFAGVYGFFMLAFLLDVAGLRPSSAGLIFAIAQIWDAITDPMVGTLSDRTRTRWGKKRPWLLLGALPFGIAFFLHWLVPPLGEGALFFYYLIVALFLRTAFTAVNVPYAALTPELTRDYDQRTQLNTFRFFFSIVGSMTAIILHPIIVSMGSDQIVGHAMSAGVWMVVITVSVWMCFAGTYELSADEPVQKMGEKSFAQRIQIVLKNRPYLIVTGLYLLSWLTLQFIQANLLLYTRYWLLAEGQFTYFVAIIQGTAALFLPVWTMVSTRIGKKRVYYAGAGIWLVVLVLIFFLQPGQANLLYVASFFAGMGVSVAYLIPWSMLPDVIEYNELETGERQEGVFYGVFVFLQKLGLSAGLFFSGMALDAAGYINADMVNGVLETVIQPDNVLLALRLFVSWIPAIALAFSIPLAILYPISRERYQEIQDQLAQRKESL
jgi:GPH family glycoside/pentoside/hexuronide:cation symporter